MQGVLEGPNFDASYQDLGYQLRLVDVTDIFNSASNMSCLSCLSVLPVLQVGRIHGIASLPQDPTSSRLIASCTDSKYVND